MEIHQFALDGLPPGSQIAVEANSVTILAGVLKLVESFVLGVQQRSVTSEELVVDYV